MQKCKSCGKEIKYIPIAKGITVTCDSEESVVYTDLGRKIFGHKVHECKGELINEDSEKSDL